MYVLVGQLVLSGWVFSLFELSFPSFVSCNWPLLWPGRNERAGKYQKVISQSCRFHSSNILYVQPMEGVAPIHLYTIWFCQEFSLIPEGEVRWCWLVADHFPTNRNGLMGSITHFTTTSNFLMCSAFKQFTPLEPNYSIITQMGKNLRQGINNTSMILVPFMLSTKYFFFFFLLFFLFLFMTFFFCWGGGGRI